MLYVTLSHCGRLDNPASCTHALQALVPTLLGLVEVTLVSLGSGLWSCKTTSFASMLFAQTRFLVSCNNLNAAKCTAILPTPPPMLIILILTPLLGFTAAIGVLDQPLAQTATCGTQEASNSVRLGC
jgi:hypothetical protein